MGSCHARFGRATQRNRSFCGTICVARGPVRWYSRQGSEPPGGRRPRPLRCGSNATEGLMAGTVASGRTSANGKREVLDQIPFFTYSPPGLQRALIEAATVVHLQAGADFLREGDSCAHFAIVVSGRIRVFKLAESGQEITLYHVGAGAISPLNEPCIRSYRP